MLGRIALFLLLAAVAVATDPSFFGKVLRGSGYRGHGYRSSGPRSYHRSYRQGPSYRSKSVQPRYSSRTIGYDPCYGDPCGSHGSCYPHDSYSGHGDRYYCKCHEGYYGDYCTDYRRAPVRDPCYGSPCGSHGTCYAYDTYRGHGDKFYCKCYEGYYGTYCDDYRDPCYDVDCGSHGYCKVYGDKYKCVCHTGWSGAYCDSRRHHGSYRSRGSYKTHY